MTIDQHYLIALGANLPVGPNSPQVVLPLALDQMAAQGVRIVARSRLFRTPCFPAGAGPDYVNAAVVARADMGPADMLALLHRIEADFGRERVQRWGMRTLDLDLIGAGTQVLPDLATYAAWRDLPLDQQTAQTPDRLILPHPRLQDRAFVLVPLRDVAPDWVHPVLGASVAQMCDALPAGDVAQVQPLE